MQVSFRGVWSDQSANRVIGSDWLLEVHKALHAVSHFNISKTTILGSFRFLQPSLWHTTPREHSDWASFPSSLSSIDLASISYGKEISFHNRLKSQVHLDCTLPAKCSLLLHSLLLPYFHLSLLLHHFMIMLNEPKFMEQSCTVVLEPIRLRSHLMMAHGSILLGSWTNWRLPIWEPHSSSTATISIAFIITKVQFTDTLQTVIKLVHTRKELSTRTHWCSGD